MSSMINMSVTFCTNYSVLNYFVKSFFKIISKIKDKRCVATPAWVVLNVGISKECGVGP